VDCRKETTSEVSRETSEDSHESKEEYEARVQLAEGLAELGLLLQERDRRQLLAFLRAVLETNKVVNLTRIDDLRSGVRLHLIDSLVPLPEVNALPQGPVLDLGSGGGFPGVPLAITTKRQFVLLDSVKKKGTAIAEILRQEAFSGIPAEVVSERAEDYAREHAGGFAGVVARAVAGLPSLVELAAPLLQIGGALVALKGCPESTELESGTAVAAMTGMEFTGMRTTALPGDPGETRTIVTYVKTGPPKIILPRRTGLAQNSPLGT
jgi:16S rRNA (guanine527-N7)-methyltransferase